MDGPSGRWRYRTDPQVEPSSSSSSSGMTALSPLSTPARRPVLIAILVTLVVSLVSLWLYFQDDLYSTVTQYLPSSSSSTPPSPSDGVADYAADFERIKLAHLDSTFDAAWYVSHLGYAGGAVTLHRPVEQYTARLAALVDKWFAGVPSHAYLLDALERVAQHRPPVPLDAAPILRRVVSTDREGPEGVPRAFGRWRKLGWEVFVADDEGMERMFDWYVQGEGEGTRRMWDVWDSLPKPVLKTDFLRYLMLLQEGGIYTDADTAPRARPQHWGHGAVNRLPASLTDYLANMTDPAAESPFLGGSSILDPEISVVIGGEYDAAIEGVLDEWIAGETQGAIRSYQMCQWTMMAKPFHPIFIDTVVSVLELLERARDAGHLDGSEMIVELTGPGPFTDAVFRYLLAAYGATPHDLYGRREPSRFGDVVVLDAYALGFPPNQYERNRFDKEDMWARPVMHAYRGAWKTGEDAWETAGGGDESRSEEGS